jgi:hypothetical protein
MCDAERLPFPLVGEDGEGAVWDGAWERQRVAAWSDPYPFPLQQRGGDKRSSEQAGEVMYTNASCGIYSLERMWQSI